MYLPSVPHQNEPLPSPIITINEYNIYTRLRSTLDYLALLVIYVSTFRSGARLLNVVRRGCG